MRKRLSAAFLLLIGLLCLLTGCGGAGQTQKTAPQETLRLIEDEETAPEGEKASPQTVQRPETEETETMPEAAASEIEAAAEPETPPAEETEETAAEPELETFPEVIQGERYTTPEEVAEYLHRYGELPDNFITKSKAKDLGWDASLGNLWDVAPGMSIGGDRFGNYEGLLPQGKYRECDVNYAGGFRGAERLIYGEDGSVYYTGDHYNSFTRLY